MILLVNIYLMNLKNIKTYYDAYVLEYDDDYGYWQEYTDELSNHYYWRYLNDETRIRQEKIDEILGLKKNPTFGDILPENLKK
jgi:hypothetical protein